MTMKTDRFQIVAGLVALAATVALAQQAARPADVPNVPPRGPLTVDAAAITEILGGIKAPPGFEVKVFAAPPIVNYPACITASLAGELFVCVDRNSSLQADPGMGSVLRLVDKNNDGQADEYTVFATMDSPRGAVFDGDTLFVVHPPSLTAYRDGDGDGIAEESRTLVRGLGFGLDFRGADHTVNGVEIGVDGWLYIAVGDYGIVKAVGSDGREIQMRGGGNVRVRPDGTGLEIYSRGTRNDYDVAIDPYLNLFARGNTNDGGGWDIRLNHFVAGANYGYPSLFRNFGDEVVAPLADYGGGSGTGMLFIQDPGLPAPFGDTLYSVDWGTNFVYRHPLTPRGASFTAGQEVFLGLPRPTDITIDGASRLYVASWKGGQYRYGGEQIGYIARLTYPGAKPSQIPDIKGASDARLVELVVSANQVHRRFAQHELLRRGPTPERVGLLEKRVLGAGPLAARVSAIFTLKQLAGDGSHDVLERATADPAVRAFALRALADRREEQTGVSAGRFVQALADRGPDARVQLEAITGLKRLSDVSAALSILPYTASTDPVVRHVAIDALVSLGASEPAWRALTAAKPSPAALNGALRVLQQMHNPQAVDRIELGARYDHQSRGAGGYPAGAGAALSARRRLARDAGGVVGHEARHDRPVLRSGHLGREPAHSRGAAPRRAADEARPGQHSRAAVDAGSRTQSRGSAWRGRTAGRRQAGAGSRAAGVGRRAARRAAPRGRREASAALRAAGRPSARVSRGGRQDAGRGASHAAGGRNPPTGRGRCVRRSARPEPRRSPRWRPRRAPARSSERSRASRASMSPRRA